MHARDASFCYAIDKDKLPQGLAGKVIEFRCDSATARFVEDCEKNPHTRLQLLASGVLSLVAPDYEVHGMLGMFPMFLLDEAHWSALVDERYQSGVLRDSLLDIGAGQGFVTRYAKGLFRTITVTETSRTMAKRLRAEGFECYQGDVARHPEAFAGRTFSVVSLLNVLDRCEYPLALLSRAVELLKDDGMLRPR